MVYLCEDSEGVKVVAKVLLRGYPKTLHEELHSKHLAPALVELREVGGGFWLLLQEYLDPADGWCPVWCLGEEWGSSTQKANFQVASHYVSGRRLL